MSFDRAAILTHFSHLHHAAARADIGGGKMVLAVYGEDPDTGEESADVQHFEIGDFEGMTAAARASWSRFHSRYGSTSGTMGTAGIPDALSSAKSTALRSHRRVPGKGLGARQSATHLENVAGVTPQ
jgi:hypothetical protein